MGVTNRAKDRQEATTEREVAQKRFDGDLPDPERIEEWREANERRKQDATSRGWDWLLLEKIRLGGGTQTRAALDESTINEYADAMVEGAIFPAITVFYDGEEHWLADGFHRVAAANRLADHHEKAVSPVGISADVRQGTQRDAILYSVGANASHGLRRTNADKRRAVLTLLTDDEWKTWSNSEIARRCGVDEKTVRKYRGEITSEVPKSPGSYDPSYENIGQSDSSNGAAIKYTDRWGNLSTMKIANIGGQSDAAAAIQMRPALRDDAPAHIQAAVDAGRLSVADANSTTNLLVGKANGRAHLSRAVYEAALQHDIVDAEVLWLLESRRETEEAQAALHDGHVTSSNGVQPLATISALALSNALREKATSARRKQTTESRLEKIRAIRRAPEGVYSIVYADPPWHYNNAGLNGSAAQHYDTMPTEEICGLLAQIQVELADDAACFLWTTAPFLPDALRVMQAWGFTYRTNAVWVKDEPTYGNLGFYVYSQHEMLLIGTRGQFLPLQKPVSVINADKGEHSAKPDEVRDLVEWMYPSQRYIELFARGEERPGWVFWGEEAEHASP